MPSPAQVAGVEGTVLLHSLTMHAEWDQHWVAIEVTI